MQPLNIFTREYRYFEIIEAGRKFIKVIQNCYECDIYKFTVLYETINCYKLCGVRIYWWDYFILILSLKSKSKKTAIADLGHHLL